MLGIGLDSNGLKIKSDIDLLHSRLERLFFLPIEDQIGALETGSRILDYFWEEDSVENAKAILTEVKFLLATYEPNIVPLNILVKFVPLNEDSLGGSALVIELSAYFVDDEEQEINVSLIKVKD